MKLAALACAAYHHEKPGLKLVLLFVAVAILTNVGELPTTITVDAKGNIRRRFIGVRCLPVFEAVIAEASQGGDANQGVPATSLGLSSLPG